MSKKQWGISWDGSESWLEPCLNANVCRHDDHYKTFAEGKKEICHYHRTTAECARDSLRAWKKRKASDCGEGSK